MDLKKIKQRIWQFIFWDVEYIFINYFIEYIPFWTIRKMLLRMLGMRIGKKSRIAMRCIIMSPGKIIIGEGNIINEFVLLDGRGGLTFGNNNSISMYAKIYTGTHKTSSETFEYISFPTEIKDNCWIGTSAVIMPGSILRDFVVVSVNSVLKGETETRGIYMGIPAKKLKERNIKEKYVMDFKSWFR